jgi:histidyl-tRNA synthetase
MANFKTAVKGTLDLLPEDSSMWQKTEKILFDTASKFGFSEIRTPVFEQTDLFQRSVGETTDVVNKEMYTFEDKGGRSITLRPELTAGVVRSFLEHGLFNEPLPIKLCYCGACYRYEKPQAGRLREFHQFGVEMFGRGDYLADSQLILLASSLLKNVGVTDAKLNINSIGCPTCRAEYHKALKAYFEDKKDKLCHTCLERLDRNPMRILDCKSEICKGIAKNAPKMIDYLCDDCKTHFEGVKSTLSSLNVEYTVNPDIVRGLDYYTKTVFEFVTDKIGAQSTVLGGGRYDGLVSELGGQPTPALGFALGMERLMLLLQAEGKYEKGKLAPELFIIGLGDSARVKGLEIASKLQKNGIVADCDILGRSVKSGMKYADKINAHYVLVLGDDEITSGKATLKDMMNKDSKEIDLDNICEEF